jgi:hypothetical protein
MGFFIPQKETKPEKIPTPKTSRGQVHPTASRRLPRSRNFNLTRLLSYSKVTSGVPFWETAH